MTDVNEEFNAQRIAQMERVQDRVAYLEGEVALGNMEKLDNGRYRVLTGWDRGEVFDAEGMPEHGLDLKQNGEVALYLKDTPAWHKLGTVIKGGLSTGAAVLQTAGLDYTVAQTPVKFHPEGEYMTEVPGKFVNYRTDTGAPLGVVGSKYTTIQNIESYAFLDGLLDHGMIADSAGSFAEGSRIFVAAQIPEDLVLDPEGVADVIKQYVVFGNSHDGSSPSYAVTTPWRPVCKNTERLAVQGAKARWNVRHTKNWKDRLDEAKRALGLTSQYYEKFAEEETSLLHTEMTMEAVDKLLDELWEKPTDNKRSVTMDANRREKIYARFATEVDRVGRNAYALERAITGYADHDRAYHLKDRSPLEALGEAILMESNEKVKHETHRKLLTLASR